MILTALKRRRRAALVLARRKAAMELQGRRRLLIQSKFSARPGGLGSCLGSIQRRASRDWPEDCRAMPSIEQAWKMTGRNRPTVVPIVLFVGWNIACMPWPEA